MLYKMYNFLRENVVLNYTKLTKKLNPVQTAYFLTNMKDLKKLSRQFLSF